MSGPEESNQNQSGPPPEGADNEQEKPVYPPLPDPGPTEDKPGEDGKPLYPPLENGGAAGGGQLFYRSFRDDIKISGKFPIFTM